MNIEQNFTISCDYFAGFTDDGTQADEPPEVIAAPLGVDRTATHPAPRLVKDDAGNH